MAKSVLLVVDAQNVFNSMLTTAIPNIKKKHKVQEAMQVLLPMGLDPLGIITMFLVSEITIRR